MFINFDPYFHPFLLLNILEQESIQPTSQIKVNNIGLASNRVNNNNNNQSVINRVNDTSAAKSLPVGLPNGTNMILTTTATQNDRTNTQTTNSQLTSNSSSNISHQTLTNTNTPNRRPQSFAASAVPVTNHSPNNSLILTSSNLKSVFFFY